MCTVFNKETKNGKRMDAISELLNDAINSIVEIGRASCRERV